MKNQYFLDNIWQTYFLSVYPYSKTSGFQPRIAMSVEINRQIHLISLKKGVECIRETMKGFNERYNIIIDELGFDGDHIHIICGAKPRYSPSQVLQLIKSITAKQVFSKLAVVALDHHLDQRAA